MDNQENDKQTETGETQEKLTQVTRIANVCDHYRGIVERPDAPNRKADLDNAKNYLDYLNKKGVLHNTWYSRQALNPQEFAPDEPKSAWFDNLKQTSEQAQIEFVDAVHLDQDRRNTDNQSALRDLSQSVQPPVEPENLATSYPPINERFHSQRPRNDQGVVIPGYRLNLKIHTWVWSRAAYNEDIK
jgi:hypothetical protein